MILPRDKMVRGLMTLFTTITTPFNPQSTTSTTATNLNNQKQHQQQPSIENTQVPVVDYSTNPTPFGKILRGELPATVYDESSTLLSFRDIYPRAPLHALVIPKRYIKNVKHLTNTPLSPCSSSSSSNDRDDDDDDALELLQNMTDMAHDIIKKEQPTAYNEGDFLLVFHIPPFTSVDHLHMHVLAPVSEMGYFARYVKYRTGSIWCETVEVVMESLRREKERGGSGSGVDDCSKGIA